MNVLGLCLLLIDISASMKILDNISVIISMKNIPTPLLGFYLIQAFDTAIGFINLITKVVQIIKCSCTVFIDNFRNISTNTH